jgi:N6-adenosine-specific RNA methylase IME4
MEQITFPNKKYQIIYADPPWRYKNYNYAETLQGYRAKRGARKEYPTQDIGWIKSLPVAEISEDDCILFLWVTWPLLIEGTEVIKAWGFEYKTIGFIWVKTNKKSGSLFWGMGKWTRSNSEPCLIGVKGKPKRVSGAVHSVLLDPIDVHSRKPAAVKSRILELVGDLSRIELFAREKDPGWDVWGNEVEKDTQEVETYDDTTYLGGSDVNPIKNAFLVI